MADLYSSNGSPTVASVTLPRNPDSSGTPATSTSGTYTAEDAPILVPKADPTIGKVVQAGPNVPYTEPR